MKICAMCAYWSRHDGIWGKCSKIGVTNTPIKTAYVWDLPIVILQQGNANPNVQVNVRQNFSCSEFKES